MYGIIIYNIPQEVISYRMLNYTLHISLTSIA